MRDLLIKFHNDLVTLSPTKLTYVSLDLATNTLSYHQVGKVVMIPYMSHTFLPKKFKVGILTQSGLSRLVDTLSTLIQIPDYVKLGVMTSLNTLQLDFYRPYVSLNLRSPQVFESIRYVSVTSRVYVNILTWMADRESKLLLKSIRKDNLNIK